MNKIIECLSGNKKHLKENVEYTFPYEKYLIEDFNIRKYIKNNCKFTIKI